MISVRLLLCSGSSIVSGRSVGEAFGTPSCTSHRENRLRLIHHTASLSFWLFLSAVAAACGYCANAPLRPLPRDGTYSFDVRSSEYDRVDLRLTPRDFSSTAAFDADLRFL